MEVGVVGCSLLFGKSSDQMGFHKVFNQILEEHTTAMFNYSNLMEHSARSAWFAIHDYGCGKRGTDPDTKAIEEILPGSEISICRCVFIDSTNLVQAIC